MAAPPKPKVADHAQEPEAGLKDEVLRFINRVPYQDSDWSLRFITKHGKPGVKEVAEAIIGQGGTVELMDWLRFSTDVSASLIHEIEQETLGQLFMSEDAQAARRVMPKVFPGACSVNAGYDEFSTED